MAAGVQGRVDWQREDERVASGLILNSTNTMPEFKLLEDQTLILHTP
jgi:hypothetical protein